MTSESRIGMSAFIRLLLHLNPPAVHVHGKGDEPAQKAERPLIWDRGTMS
jgi:hypothetical protein